MHAFLSPNQPGVNPARAANPTATSVAVVASGGRLQVCYIDESGCTGALPAADAPIQPVLVIVGIALHQPHLAHLTHEFLDLKRTFFPALFTKSVPALSHVRIEVKGADVRTNIRTGGRNLRRHSLRYLDGFVRLLEKYNAKIFGRIWIKGIGMPVKGRAIYAFSIQAICSTFQNALTVDDDTGIIIADSRTPYLNAGVSHSIFTQKFKVAGDSYDRLLEMPTFGHSENHVGLQFTDLLCSALLSPIAMHTYCTGHVTNMHVHTRYEGLKDRFAARLAPLQHRYFESGRSKGGVTVDDKHEGKSSYAMFH